MSNEPIGIVGTIVAFVGAVATLFVAFGVSLSDAQTAAISAVIVAAAPLVTWWRARRNTVPVDKANAQIEQVAKLPATSNQATINDLKFTKG